MGRRIDPSWGGPIELFLVPGPEWCTILHRCSKTIRGPWTRNNEGAQTNGCFFGLILVGAPWTLGHCPPCPPACYAPTTLLKTAVTSYCSCPLSDFSFQPVLHDWCNKGRGMCYPVCGMVHIKEHLLLIDKSSLCGGSGFPFSLSEWS